MAVMDKIYGDWRRPALKLVTGLAFLGLAVGVAGTIGGAVLGFYAAGAGASALWTMTTAGIGAGIGNLLGRAGMALIHGIGAALEDYAAEPAWKPKPDTLEGLPSGNNYDSGGLGVTFSMAKNTRTTGIGGLGVSTARIFKEHPAY